MRTLITTALAVLIAAPVAAQAPAQPRVTAQQRNQRYQISTMEKVLGAAVEHGAKVTRDRLQAFVPADMLLSDNARVRGYRLDGYGMFFDVAVPMLEGSLTWSFRTLDQNALGIESALTALRSLVEKTGDTNVEQALKRIELQVAPVSLNAAVSANQAPAVPETRSLTGADRILEDPEQAYRAEVRDALIEAMLDHGTALRIAPAELMTVAARGGEDRSSLGPLHDDQQTIMITVRGADLTAYLSGQIGRDEARQRISVRVF